MRPRRVFVKAHRGSPLRSFVWLAIVSDHRCVVGDPRTGRELDQPRPVCLVPGDVGPDAAAAAAAAELPDDTTVWGVTLPATDGVCTWWGPRSPAPTTHFDFSTCSSTPEPAT